MRRISNPIVPNAVVALLVVSAFAVGAGGGHAQAEDCLAAPNVSSPPGQHWYYRIDRATRRHCWYLHAPLRGAHQAHSAPVVANAEIEHPVAAVAMPFAAAPMPVANAPMPAADPPLPAPAAATDNTSSQPHVTVLAVKTVAVPALEAPAETQSRHRVSAAPIEHASARAYGATPEKKSDSPIFFVLVFGLGVATFLMAIVIKCVAPRAGWPLRPMHSGVGIDWRQERA